MKKAFAYLVCFILLSNPGSIIRSLAMFMTYFTEEKQSAEVYIIFSFMFDFFHPFAFVTLILLCNSEITDIDTWVHVA